VEIIGQIQLRRGAGLDADRAPVELERRLKVAALGDEKGLTVVIGHAREDDAVIALAPQRPGRIAREDVDLLVLKRAEPLLGREGRVLHLRRVVEDRRRERAAEVDVEARPLALVVLDREALEALVDAADERAAILDGLERLGLRAGAERNRSRESEERRHLSHE